MITTIHARNLKGSTFSHKLSPLTIFTGRNGSGKTTRLEAIRLALTGRHAVGTANGKIFTLSSGSELEVCAETTLGDFTRSWKQAGKRVTGAENLPEREWPPVFDSTAFFDLTPSKRLERVAMVASDDVLAKLVTAFTAEGQRLRPGAIIESAQEAISAVKDELSEARTLTKRATSTVEELTVSEAQAGIGEDPATLDAAAGILEGRIAELRGKLGGLRAEHARREGSMQAAEDASRELESADEQESPDELEKLFENAQTLAFTAGREKLNREREYSDAAREELRAKDAAGYVPPRGVISPGAVTPTDISAALAEELDAIDAFDHPEVANMKMGEAKAKASTLLATLSGVLASGADAAARHRRAEESLAALADMESCPTCRQNAEGWKNHAWDAITAESATARSEVETLTAQKTSLEAEIAAAQAIIESAQEALAAHQRRDLVERCFTHAQGAVQAAGRLPGLTAAREEAEAALEKAALAHDEAQALADELRQRRDAARRLAHLHKVIADAPHDDDIAAGAGAIVQTEMELEETLEELSGVNDKRAAAGRAANRAREIERARSEAEAAESRVAELSERAKRLSDAYALALSDAFNVIVGPANELAEGIVNGTFLAVDGDIGILRGEVLVPFDGMCGAEQMILLTAVQIGLAGAGPKVVMLDEVSRLDRQNREQLRDTLVHMLDNGWIDQAILADHDADVWADHDFIPITPVNA